jgi:hypothetical protein
MGLVWEYKWPFWNDKASCFEQTLAWMTETEARSDWFYYTDPRSYAIEHTKRDRNRGGRPIMGPPDEKVDWAKERRKREDAADLEIASEWDDAPAGAGGAMRAPRHL